jgi:hypothetical protein
MKVTMKIEEGAHRKLQMAKGMMGTKTLSETIKVLAEQQIEIGLKKVKK